MGARTLLKSAGCALEWNTALRPANPCFPRDPTAHFQLFPTALQLLQLPEPQDGETNAHRKAHKGCGQVRVNPGTRRRDCFHRAKAKGGYLHNKEGSIETRSGSFSRK